MVTHTRVTEAAFTWTAQFAAAWEAQHVPQQPTPEEAPVSPPRPAGAMPESPPASLATTEEVDYGDSGGGFDEEMVPDDEAAPPTPPPPAPAIIHGIEFILIISSNNTNKLD